MSLQAPVYPFSQSIPPNFNIDLTTVQAVRDYAQVKGTGDDNQIQMIITAFSQEFLRITGRSNMDGTLPIQSPFVAQQYYDEWYDGSGTLRQFVRNFPIYGTGNNSLLRACTPSTLGYPNVFVNGQAIPFSPNIPGPGPNYITNGFVVDGSGKSISIRLPGPFPNSPDGGPFSNNTPFYAASNFLGTCFAFARGVQNVEIQYWAGFAVTPMDIVRAATQIVAINYKRANWIDMGSKTLSAGGGASGTTRYRDWRIPPECQYTIEFYTRSAIV
jgi:hypothetical protein